MIIDLFFFYSFVVLCSISVFGHGIIFHKLLINTKVSNPGLIGLFGFFLLFAISIFFHFFINLNQYFNLTVLSIGLIIGLINLNFFKNIKKYNYFFIFFIIIFLLSSITSRTYADYEWYHLPYVNYLTDFKIIFGLVNFSNNYNYGHGWLDIMGLFTLPLIETKGLTSLPIIFYFYFIIFFLHELFNSKNLPIIIYSLFTITLTFVCFNRLKDFGADIQPTFTIFIFIFFILKYIFEEADDSFFKYIIIFFFYSCILRIGSVVSLPIFLFFLVFNIKSFYKDILKNNIKIYFFLFLFFIFFLSKNFITSGCLFYPIPITCFESQSISWASPKENTYERFEFLSAISKRWKFYSIEEGELNNKYEYYDKIENQIIMSPEEFNENQFFWIKYFFHDHDYKRILNFFIFALIFFSTSLFYLKKTFNITNYIRTNYMNYFIISLLISIIFWFLNSPQMRYGGYPLFGVLTYLIAILTFKYNGIVKDKFILFRNFLLIIGIMYFGYKNINNTIYDISNNIFTNFPWANVSEKVEGVDFYSKNFNGIKVNFIVKNEDVDARSPKMCGKVPMPCLPSGREVCISELTVKNNYIFVSNTNKKCLEQFKKNYWQH